MTVAQFARHINGRAVTDDSSCDRDLAIDPSATTPPLANLPSDAPATQKEVARHLRATRAVHHTVFVLP
jgi:hypothetical protein